MNVPIYIRDFHKLIWTIYATITRRDNCSKYITYSSTYITDIHKLYNHTARKLTKERTNKQTYTTNRQTAVT